MPAQSPANTGTAQNVLVGYANIWTAPFASGSPATEPAIVSTTGLAVPTSPWVASGFTEEGLNVELDKRTTDIRVEEQSTPILVTFDELTVNLVFTVMEDTLANMKLAYGGGTLSTITPATGVAGETTLNLSENIDQLSFFAQGWNSLNLGRTIYVPSVNSVGRVQTRYRRAASARMYTVTLHALSAPSAIIIRDVTATHA